MADRPRLLDTFCGAGGCTKGYQMAGFYVVGVDNRAQPHYCGDEFVQADAIEFIRKHGREYDAIHASPPCQFASQLRTLHAGREYHNFIPDTRNALMATGRPWVIENVAGARRHLIEPIMLCGTMFGLGVDDAELRRHRLFELSGFLTLTPTCKHKANRVCGIYGGHGRDRRVITVVGHTGGRSTRQATNGFTMNQRNVAMGIDWMTQAELSQAIPPAYTEWIGARLLEYLAAI